MWIKKAAELRERAKRLQKMADDTDMLVVAQFLRQAADELEIQARQFEAAGDDKSISIAGRSFSFIPGSGDGS